MLFKIAFRNMWRQIGGYFIYFVTVALTVSILFSLNSMMFSQLIFDFSAAFKMETTLACAFLAVLLSVVSAAVFGYGTAFLLRRRKREFGLYLTLGMSRGNIMTIFSIELLFTFLLSLGAGIGLGTLVYQVIVAGINNFLQAEFIWADYTVEGFALTFIMVGVMFLLSSAVSLAYLRLTKVAKLLQGQSTVEKTVKNPGLWIRVTLVAAVVFVLSLLIIVFNVENTSSSSYAFTLVGCSAAAFISIVLMYVGAMKSVIYYLLKNRRFSARGTRTFTLRQLSGRMSADSLLIGVIAVLLSIVLTGGNGFLTIVNAQTAQSRINNPFTVSIASPYVGTGELTAEVPAWVEQFGEVEESHRYTVYELSTRKISARIEGYANTDWVMRESDYLILAEMAGEKAEPIGDGIAILGNRIGIPEMEEAQTVDLSDFTLDVGGHTLSVSFLSPIRCSLAAGGSLPSFYAVAPDAAVDAVAAGEGGGYLSANTFCAVNYAGGKFDEEGLRDFFFEKNREDVYSKACENASGWYTNSFFYVAVSGSFNQALVQMAAPFLIILIFVTVTFTLLSIAVLALKSLAAVSEDKRRYKLLFLSGATEKETLRSLAVQLLVYFFLPFAVPIFLNIPVSFICMALNGFFGGYMPNIQVVGFAAMFSGMLLLFYALYCAVVYLVSRADVKKTLRAAG